MGRVRGLTGGIALAAALAVLAGCTDDTSSPSPAPPPTQDTGASTDVTLRLGVHGNERVVMAYREIADAFTEDHPGVTVEIEPQADARSAAAATAAALDAGEGPDAFLLHEDWLPQFVEAGHLQPLDLLLEERGLQFGDDYQRVALTAFSANSGLQCMPAEMSPLVVFHNKRLLPRRQLLAQGVRLPEDPEQDTWDWEDFTATARAAAALSPGSPQSPVHGAYLPPDVELLTAFLRSAGTDVVGDVLDPSALTLASDESVETLRLVAALTRDPTVSPSAEEVAASDPLTTFLEGRLAMYVGTRADVPAMRATDGLRFDVYPLPSIDRARAVAETSGLCVSATSEHVEAATDFVAFAVGEEGAEIAARSGAIVPSHLDTIVSEPFTQPGQRPRNEFVFAESLRRSDLLPYSTAWPAVSERVERLLGRIYLDQDFDLDQRLLPALERLDTRSERWFDASAEPSDEPSDGVEEPSPSETQG